MSLYIVATPIGNLEDLSPRALRILKSVKIIIVEKWTDSIKLLNHFDIHPEKLLTYDERNKKRITSTILDLLRGQDGALITSAGTPAISDPGADLIKHCYQQKISVIPIPGASALSAAISVSGFRGPFLFWEFLPRKISHRNRLFEVARLEDFRLVFFDSPYRVVKTLEQVQSFDPEAQVFVGKEMTKKFETYLVDKPQGLLQRFVSDKNFGKGEFTLIVNFATH